MTKCGHRPTAGGCGRGSEPRGRGPCDIDRATPGAAGRRGSRYKSWVQVPEVRIEFLYSLVQTSSTFPVAWIYLGIPVSCVTGLVKTCRTPSHRNALRDHVSDLRSIRMMPWAMSTTFSTPALMRAL